MILRQIGLLTLRGSVLRTPSIAFLSTSTQNHYDIVIVGGGMVGGTLASALGKEEIIRTSLQILIPLAILSGQRKVLSNQKILLLEGAPKFKGFSAEGEFSNRVSTLNNGTKQLLDSIGIWDQIKSKRANPVYDMQVWDASSNAFITFDSGHDPIAHVVENDLVLDCVYKSLQPLSNVTVKYDSRIENFNLTKDERQPSSVFLKSGEEFSCSLLVRFNLIYSNNLFKL